MTDCAVHGCAQYTQGLDWLSYHHTLSDSMAKAACDVSLVRPAYILYTANVSCSCCIFFVCKKAKNALLEALFLIGL